MTERLRLLIPAEWCKIVGQHVSASFLYADADKSQCMAFVITASGSQYPWNQCCGPGPFCEQHSRGLHDSHRIIIRGSGYEVAAGKVKVFASRITSIQVNPNINLICDCSGECPGHMGTTNNDRSGGKLK